VPDFLSWEKTGHCFICKILFDEENRGVVTMFAVGVNSAYNGLKSCILVKSDDLLTSGRSAY
jgi:hypothetical protein